MRRAGLVVAEAHAAVREAAAPGVTTGELDVLAREVLARHGATSSFLNYGAGGLRYPPYPGVTCISVNEEIVHGIPGDRVLVEGDLVSYDFGAIVDGWHGDGAITFGVGELSPADARLSDVTREAMWAGIGAAHLRRPGERHLSRHREAHPRAAADLRHPPRLHRPRHRLVPCTSHPTCPTTAVRGAAPDRGGAGCSRSSRWSLWGRRRGRHPGRRVDRGHQGRWLARRHWEHTITVTPAGLWVLTALDGGEAELTARGLPYGPLAD